jgi:Icc-related predicted phosphoesterase
MRLLVVADIHYALPQYDWVTEVAPRFDAVIIAGDHLDANSLVDLPTQIIVIQKYLERLRKVAQRLIICSGNHDLDTRDEAGEKVTRWILAPRKVGVPTDGDSLTIGDTLITICPWWDGPRVRAGIDRQLDADAAQRGKKWFWVHHAPPKGAPISWDGYRDYGDLELQQWIAKHAPDMVFCGHVHQAPFSADGSWVDRIGSTWVFNAGRQIGAPPTYIVVDTDKQLALWLSDGRDEIVHLDAPLQRPVAKMTELPDWLV